MVVAKKKPAVKKVVVKKVVAVTPKKAVKMSSKTLGICAIVAGVIAAAILVTFTIVGIPNNQTASVNEDGTEVLGFMPLALGSSSKGAPSGVSVTTAGSGAIMLMWNNVTWANTYTVYRKDAFFGFVQPVATVAAQMDVTSMMDYTDRGLVQGKKYFYRISATGANGQGNKSWVKSAKAGL